MAYNRCRNRPNRPSLNIDTNVLVMCIDNGFQVTSVSIHDKLHKEIQLLRMVK